MITTVTLALGAVRMAREKVIVKHLSAIQNLGSIDVLCSDKTGTLTAGTMSLDAALDPEGRPSERTFAFARLNSRFESGIQSPLDAAILERVGDDFAGVTKTDEIPFDFERRRLSVVVEQASVPADHQGGTGERVSPAQKHRIIQALRSRGHVVGFLGDGITPDSLTPDEDIKEGAAR
jgi:P-type E1-E2 ATPase